MDLENHRIYTRMSEPLKIAGLTKEEIIMGAVGIMSFVICRNRIVGGSLMVGSFIGVYLFKKFKKGTERFRLSSWLRFKFGLSSSKTHCFPPSHERYFK